MCAAVGVGEAHLVRSSKSLCQLERHVLPVDPDSGFTFSMFMATPLFTLAFLASVISVGNQSGSLLVWCRGLLGFVFGKFGENYTLEVNGVRLRVRRRAVVAGQVLDLVRSLDLLVPWKQKPRGQGVILPDIERDLHAPVLAVDIFYGLVRYMEDNDAAQAAGKTVIKLFARVWDVALPSQLLDEPRRCQFKAENDRLRAKALRGEDKVVLLVNSTLARRQGSALEQEVRVREVSHWRSCSYARATGTVSLVSCAINKGLQATTDAIKAWGEAVLGVRASFDDSRVSSKESRSRGANVVEKSLLQTDIRFSFFEIRFGGHHMFRHFRSENRLRLGQFFSHLIVRLKQRRV